MRRELVSVTMHVGTPEMRAVATAVADLPQPVEAQMTLKRLLDVTTTSRMSSWTGRHEENFSGRPRSCGLGSLAVIRAVAISYRSARSLQLDLHQGQTNTVYHRCNCQSTLDCTISYYCTTTDGGSGCSSELRCCSIAWMKSSVDIPRAEDMPTRVFTLYPLTPEKILDRWLWVMLMLRAISERLMYCPAKRTVWEVGLCSMHFVGPTMYIKVEVSTPLSQLPRGTSAPGGSSTHRSFPTKIPY